MDGITLQYGEPISFEQVPEPIQRVVEQEKILSEPDLFGWRRLILGETAVWKTSGEVVLPVAMMLKTTLGNDCPSGSPARLQVACETQCVPLSRLYDGHIPTRYLLGLSQETGQAYWVEEFP